MTVGPIVVRLTSVSKRFGDHAAVDDVTLEVAAGEILTVLGPSGCGKTTLLRLIAGFETPDAGEIHIGGRPAVGPGIFRSPEQRRVGMVFQQLALFPHLTVEQNVAFGLTRSAAGSQRERVRRLLDLIGMSDAGRRYPHELSGGQQQRVALVRALAPEPFVALLDEPFSDLDADQRLRLREEVRQILKRSGTTAVFVTHDQEEAFFMGDRMAVLHQGGIEQIGEPEAVFSAPGSPFVAEFLGQTEFLPATVAPGGLQTELGVLQQPIDLPQGLPILLGHRSDDVDFAADDRAGSIVLARSFRGPVCLYRIQLPSGRVVHSMQPHFRRDPVGTRVRVWLDPNHVLPWFPAPSGDPV